MAKLPDLDFTAMDEAYDKQLQFALKHNQNLVNTAGTLLDHDFDRIASQVFIKVQRGQMSAEQAIAQASKELKDSGTLKVQYPKSGRQVNLKSALATNVRTMSKRIALHNELSIGDQTGCDAYEITAFGDCAKDHQWLNGQIFTLKQMEDLEVVEALQRPNCRHIAYPYWRGYSNPADFGLSDEQKEVSSQALREMMGVKSQKSGIIGGKHSEAYNRIMAEIQEREISYNEVKSLEKKLTEDEIINKISGGDETRGSCSSVAFTYAGNKNGLDVLDYRGGASRTLFSLNRTIENIANLPGVEAKIIASSNDINAAKELLNSMKDNKEYYLSTGGHAAVVKKLNNRYMYLELQNPQNNGWKPFTNLTLKKRFGCQKSNVKYGMTFKPHNILINIDSLRGNKEFTEILGYINTNIDKQMKGNFGYAK